MPQNIGDDYRNIESWQSAKEVVVLIYKHFSDLKDFNFRNQIQSAALSSMSNIAEGYGRFNKNEFRHFLQISMGSVVETRSLLEIALELHYCSEAIFNTIDGKLLILTKQLKRFIQYLNKKDDLL